MVRCVWCREREIAQDIFCQQCFDELEMVQKEYMSKTLLAECIRLGLAVEELKQAIRTSLPRWLQWIIWTL